MSNSIFRDDVEEDHDDEDHDSDQEQLESRKDEEEFVDQGDKKEEEEVVNVDVTGGDEFLEKKQQQQSGDGVSSTEDDENDGFRTPTSLEHRIPVPTQCPPAPKKSCKRKFDGSSITDIIRSAAKVIHDQFMVFKKAREDEDALS
ncbi:hypothetical protein POM88_009819 [Heracleum sosnowskyi]|uniref:Uncharacterized protein n=1 Tax=Heracleum sosnowskyi TaxID=360622 RepID=A0AAD8JC72_9APIA|nr:hypothetical protein POM88_009819 [Heracleum sosnowskyi]